MRAVGGHAAVVAEYPPAGIGIYLVEHGVGGGEVACDREVVVYHHAHEFIVRRGVVEPGDFGVTESAVRKARLPRFLAATLEDIHVLAGGCAQIVGV